MMTLLTLAELPDDVWDAVILGAGPAGSVAALKLGRLGMRTLIVDRRMFPRPKVCGGCLNARALGVLEAIGLSDRLKAMGGIRLEALELSAGSRSLRLGIPRGLGVSRERLDHMLLEAAVDAGAAFLPAVEGRVGEVAGETREVVLANARDSFRVRARVVVAATGLGPVRFEGDSPIQSRVASHSRIGVGCVIEGCPDRYRVGTIYIVVGRGGYVGMVRVEDGRLNVAAALDREFVRSCGDPAAAAGRILRMAGFDSSRRLDEAAWRGTGPLTRQARPIAGERWFLLGDTTGYVEPFTGEGMAWALTSADRLAPLVARSARSWDPSAVSEWSSLHRRLVTRRQHTCRALAALLRHPRLSRAVAGLTVRAPGLAQVLINRVNASPQIP